MDMKMISSQAFCLGKDDVIPNEQMIQKLLNESIIKQVLLWKFDFAIDVVH
jgi:hypothetical protein